MGSRARLGSGGRPALCKRRSWSLNAYVQQVRFVIIKMYGEEEVARDERSCRVRRSWKVLGSVLIVLVCCQAWCRVQIAESANRVAPVKKPDAMSVRWKAIQLTGRCGSVAPQEIHCVSVRQSSPCHANVL